MILVFFTLTKLMLGLSTSLCRLSLFNDLCSQITKRNSLVFTTPTAVVTKSLIFWDVTPCSRLKVKPTFRRNTLPPSTGHRIRQARHQYKAGFLFDSDDCVTCSSETPVDFQQTARRYISEDKPHHNSVNQFPIDVKLQLIQP
jgi:hypothetical protein